MSTPPVISALPDVPATSDPQFEIKAPALFSAIKNTFIGEVNSVASWINAGSWLTNPLAVGSGGTGLATIPAGRIMYGNDTSAVSTSASLTYDGTTFSVLGNLTVDTSTLVVNAATNRVGIGTSSPLGKLDARATSGAQIVASYDASNRFDIVVGSSGSANCELVGAAKIFQIYGGSSTTAIDSRVTNYDTNAYGALSSYWTEASVKGYIGALKHGSAGDVLFTGETADGFGIRAESVLEFGIGATGVGRWNTTGLAIGSLFNPSAALHVIRTTEQLRLGYDVSNYTSLTTDSSGNFTISPTGGGIRINQAPAGSAGAATGTFLTLNLNGTVYKIALLANA